MVLRVALPAKVKLSVISLTLLFVCFSLPVVSQRVNSIDLEEIPQRKVRKYIEAREIDQMPDFSSIHASWKNEPDKSAFNFSEKTFFLNYRLASVWECYRHASPVKTWNGSSFRLGLLISKRSNSVIYVNSTSFPEADTGQVFFLNLRLLKGLVNVPVSFEVINIDSKQQIIEISYIENNKSKGKQSIQFFDNGDGDTRIVHRTYFKSGSWLYDEILYPHFHKKFVREFHRNMRQHVKNSNPVIPL